MELNHQFALPLDRSVGIGCIGSGFIMTECHLEAYRASKFDVVAIASRTPARAHEAARRHGIGAVYQSYHELLQDRRVEVVDIAVPPDALLGVIQDVVDHKIGGADHLRGILAQKPLGVDFSQAQLIVDLCREANLTLAVNQNMRYDQSVVACKEALNRGLLGQPVLATIDMRAIPHWMPWQQRLGWLTLRIMSIHHLDAFRYWFGDPARVYASIRTDPRTAARYDHEDGICLYILEYDDGLRATSCDDVWAGPVFENTEPTIGINWRVEGTEGLARGTIGWPDYPKRTPSTIDVISSRTEGWHRPRWNETWFPDAFAGPMAELLCALEQDREPTISGRDNLHTMAIVDACYLSARLHRAVSPREITQAAFALNNSGHGELTQGKQRSAQPTFTDL
jgi:predicted dehydrogenase